mgnify:CR=1 FL=1
MTPRVILSLPMSHPDRLAPFVERCLAADIELLAICGAGASRVQDDVFDLLVSDGTGPDRDLLTSFHEDGIPGALELFAELRPEIPYAVHRI